MASISGIIKNTTLKSLASSSPSPISSHSYISNAIWSWVPPILQAIIGVLIAGLLAKIIADWWYKKFASPKVLIGLIFSPNRLEAYIGDTKVFNASEMEADTIDFPIWVNLDTKWWFTKDEWKIQLNVITPENVKMRDVLELQEGIYQVFSGIVPKGTWYKVSGANLHIQKPFISLVELEVRVKINGKVTTAKLKIYPTPGAPS